MPRLIIRRPSRLGTHSAGQGDSISPVNPLESSGSAVSSRHMQTLDNRSVRSNMDDRCCLPARAVPELNEYFDKAVFLLF